MTPKNRSGESAFTLLELVLAATIGVSIFIPAAALGIRGLSVWQRADSRLQQLFRIEKELNMLGEDLRNAVAQPDLPFKWSLEGLVFVAAVDPAHLLELRYRLESRQDGTQTLIRESRTFPSVGRGPFLTKTLFPKTRSFSVQFGVRRPAQRTVSWADRWIPPEDQMISVPILVRVRMEVEDRYGKTESILREYRIPAGIFGVPSQ